MSKWDRAPLAPIAGRHSPDDMPPPAWRRLTEVAWHLPRMLSGLADSDTGQAHARELVAVAGAARD